MNNEKQITLILVTHPPACPGLSGMCNEILKKEYKEAFPIGRWGTRVCLFPPIVTHPPACPGLSGMCNEILKKDYKEAFPIGRWGTRVYPFSLVPLVTMLQRGNVEKVLAAHGFNRGKNEYKEIKL